MDETTAVSTSHDPPWVGRVQQTVADRVQLITPTGYEWTAAASSLRPATGAERAEYDVQVKRGRQAREALRRQLAGGVAS
ncbi:hypothetical protein ABZ820_41685 [Streptomyces diacarni]|uniref:hypothetical protein n=1 Tax=Streptomyces diacarni TaxID=2800381 RepID=UPI0033E26DEF